MWKVEASVLFLRLILYCKYISGNHKGFCKTSRMLNNENKTLKSLRPRLNASSISTWRIQWNVAYWSSKIRNKQMMRLLGEMKTYINNYCTNPHLGNPARDWEMTLNDALATQWSIITNFLFQYVNGTHSTVHWIWILPPSRNCNCVPWVARMCLVTSTESSDSPIVINLSYFRPV